MNRSLPILLTLIAATGAAELALLSKIAAHPAGTGDATGEVFNFFVTWAALPLVACLFAGVLLVRRGRVVPLAGYSVALGLGVLFAVIALAQYGHATPGFLLLALISQFGLVVVSTRKAW